jgi:hypothetical protein
LQVSSSDDESEYHDRRRGGGAPHSRPSLRRRRSRDLERKTSDENVRFRSRRDDYESDEGEALRRSKGPPGDGRRHRRRDYDDDGYDDGYPPERRHSMKDKIKDKLSLPLRGKPRDPEDQGVQYGSVPHGPAALAGAAAGAGPAAMASRPRVRGYDTDPERPRRRNTVGEYDRERRRHDEYSDDDRGPPPRRRNSIYDDRGYRSDGRTRRDRYDDYDDYDSRRDDGYRSGGGRDRNSLRARPRQDPYYSDYRDDRGYRPRDRDRDRYLDDYYDRRDPYGRRDRYDDPYDRRGGRRGGRDSAGGWQKEAAAAFVTYGLPVLQKEGIPFMKKNLAKFLDKQGRRGT